jgi:catechol 2,3-dioxygenase-like lactoylglutathione lyase family enzyme
VSERPGLRVSASVLDSRDPQRLGRFYARLLGWDVVADEPTWFQLKPPGDHARTGLSFQLEPDHARPVWPAQPEAQQMQAHLDIGVADLAAGVAWAIGCGAVEAQFQPQPDVRVMLDPDGHPFCLFTDG